MASVTVLPALPQSWAAPDSQAAQSLARASHPATSLPAMLLTPGRPHAQPSSNGHSSPLDPPTLHTCAVHFKTSPLMHTTS